VSTEANDARGSQVNDSDFDQARTFEVVCPADGRTNGGHFEREWEERSMAKLKNVNAKVEMHPEHKTPKRLFDIEAKPSKSDPRTIAEAFLKKVAADLKIDASLSEVQFEQVRPSILGSHVLFQQYLDGKPISRAWVRVDIDPEGRVFNLQNDLVPTAKLKKVTKKAGSTREALVAARQLTAEEASVRAVEAVRANEAQVHEVHSTELVQFPVAGVPTLAWKVIVRTEQPAGEWKVYLDAESGAVLEQLDLLRTATGRGRVFDPHPVATLSDTSLTDTSTIPDAAYVEVDLPDLEGSGHLDGPFVNTKTTSTRVKRASGQFLFKRPDRAFKEVMVYFHIDRAQRYIQSLGFEHVLNRSISANIDGTTDDNSFYRPSTKDLTFGTGGVDDAEDAEIILHEYGHAIQDDQVPGFGPSGEARAMGEGFGDYLAASFFADSKPQAMRPTLGNWDAVFYSGAEPPCLRRLDSNKLYPRDMVGEEHADGEIWSACLWQLRGALGRATADKLVLTHHTLIAPTATFEDAANALITADKQLNEGRNEAAIRDVFVRRGILPNPKRKMNRAGVPFDEIVRK
jgi:Zn-dependent metalloprotease